MLSKTPNRLTGGGVQRDETCVVGRDENSALAQATYGAAGIAIHARWMSASLLSGAKA